jgi:hypothetical protein
MKQIVFKNQQGEIVQIVQGDDLEAWLERAKASSSWNDKLSYNFEEVDNAVHDS